MSHDEIWFYNENQTYGEFSNFYKLKNFKMKFGDKLQKFETSEAYFQAFKFLSSKSTQIDLKYAEIISLQKTGTASANLGRQKNPRQNYAWAQLQKELISKYKDKAYQRKDWAFVKDNVMRRVVYHKFLDKQLQKKILETNSKDLYEHTSRDDYWGNGFPKGNTNIHGKGKNKLGLILEETRFILGGKLSNRYKLFSFAKANWLIPGILIHSANPPKEFIIKEQIDCVVSLLDENDDTCEIKHGVIYAKWKMFEKAHHPPKKNDKYCIMYIVCYWFRYENISSLSWGCWTFIINFGNSNELFI